MRNSQTQHALNENVLSTMLRGCLGIETLKQQMLGQAVLNRLPFKDYFTLPDDEGQLCFLSPPSAPNTHSELRAFTIWWRILFFCISHRTMKVKDLSHAATPGAEGWMSIQCCSLVHYSIFHMCSACTDTTQAQTGGRHIYARVHAHS